MRIIFWGSLAALLYVYLGYPALALLLAKARPARVRKAPFRPEVTILITAHNERENIGKTLRNKLELDYPREKMEIIVVSDASADGTDDIVRGYAGKGVRLIRQEERRGKTAALNLGVERARGEILAFSDANSEWGPEALSLLMENFGDPRVGYVTGKMVYTSRDGTIVGDGCTSYMKYENCLRRLETEFNSVVGVDGGIDAVRKSLYRPMRDDQLPDLVLPLRVVEGGYRVVYEPRALLREPALENARDEYRMRVRVSLRAWWALFEMKGLLNFARHGLFSLELLSHKYLRYLAFAFMAALYLANASLWSRAPGFKAFLVAQTAFYLAVPAAHLLRKLGCRPGLLYIPYYFNLVNLASAHAFLKFTLGKKQALWTPRT